MSVRFFDTGLGVDDIRAVVESVTDGVLGFDTAYTRASERGTAPGELEEFLGPGRVWRRLPAGVDAGS